MEEAEPEWSEKQEDQGNVVTKNRKTKTKLQRREFKGGKVVIRDTSNAEKLSRMGRAYWI